MSRGGRQTAAWSAFICAGIMYGFARRAPEYAFFAWLAVAAVAFGLTRLRGRKTGVFGPLLALWIAQAIGVSWTRDLYVEALPWPERQRQLVLIAEYIVFPFSVAIPIGLAHLLAPRRLPVWLWLPVAWAIGEQLKFLAIHVNIDRRGGRGGDGVVRPAQAPFDAAGRACCVRGWV